MAVLGKIRSRGVVLICVIGFALFAFVAEEAFRSCDSTRAERSQRAGEVLGEKINAQDYSNYVEEFVESMKIDGQQASDEQLREAAWDYFVQEKIIENECKALGLTVTDQEIQDIMTKGTDRLLMSIPIPDFHNQQTGRFDVNAYSKFMAQYEQNRGVDPNKDKLYKYLLFKEKQLRQNTLMQKYQQLVAACVLSNPVEAQFTFDAEKQESDVQLAYIDYRSINDKDVNVTDADLQKKYDELKPVFALPQEIRSIKYVTVKKVASEKDRNDLFDSMKKAAQEMDSVKADEVVRKFQSIHPYTGVLVTKNAFSKDIAQIIDSMAVGQVKGPVESKLDNSFNVIKLISKTQLPDSVQYRVIGVDGKTLAESKTRADSIYKALQGGADFEQIAKVYGQTGAKEWLTTNQYERATNINKDNAAIFNELNNLAVNEMKLMETSQGSMIIQVLDRKHMVTKYDVALVKRTIDYSDETSHEIGDKFNQFVAANQSLEAIEKNAAKSGYVVKEITNASTSSNGLPGVANSREAQRWVFKAEKGQVSDVIKCGNNSDELIVMVLTDIYPKGFMPLTNPQVNSMVKDEATKDKKAEKAIAQLKGIASIADAKAKGAQVDTVKQITLASPVFIPAIQAQEPALSGAVAATAKGKMSAKPVKGNNAVYVFQVIDRRTLEGKFDNKEYQNKAAQRYLNNIGQTFQNELMKAANVTDNRYLFM